MKKNRMMRLASVLLVCVLLTTSVISGTFAKYVTTDSSTDSARVAKWGVDVNVAVDGAFAAEYAANGDVRDHMGVAIAKTVVSANGEENVLAPGTSGALLESATIAGTPEVAVKVTKVADLVLTGWTAEDGSYYCPLKITVDNTAYYGMDDKYLAADNALAAFVADIENALSSIEKYGPNTNLAETHAVSWEWVFEGSDGKQTDVKDTWLGDAAADGNAATISFTYTITVEQVD